MTVWDITSGGNQASSGVGVGGNVGAQVAAAAAIVITEFVTEITGTGTITTINGLVSGRAYTLIAATGATWVLGTGGNIARAYRPAVGVPFIVVMHGTSVRPLNDLPVATATPFSSLQAIINSVGAAGGGTIDLQAGNYSPGAVTVSYNNITLRAPWGAVTFTQTANQKMFDISGRTAINFEGITFQLGSWTGVGSYGIFGDTVTNTTITRCSFVGGAWGCEIRNYNNLKFVECIGTTAGQFPMVANGGTGVWFVNCKSFSNSIAGIKVGTINTIRTGKITIASTGSTAVVGIGTLFLTQAVVGGYILANGVDARITGITDNLNMAIQAWTGAPISSPGVDFYADAMTTNADVFIIGNECFSNTGDGINVGSNALTNCVIANNISRGNTGYGIVVKQVYNGTAFSKVSLGGINTLSDNTAGGLSFQRNDATSTFSDVTVTGVDATSTNSNPLMRLSGLARVSLRGNDLYSTVTAAQGVLMVNTTNCVVAGNYIHCDRAVRFENQVSTDVTDSNRVERNSLEAHNGANGYPLVGFYQTGTGTLAAHSNNTIRDNQMSPDVYTIIDTGTTNTYCYANVIADAASAAPAIYAHIGDVVMNRTPQTADGGGAFVEKWVAVVTGNPSTFKKEVIV